MLKALTVPILAALFAASSAAQVPGYETISVTNTSLDESRPSINVHGQIVFAARVGSNNSTFEIFLYDDRSGETTQLTQDNRHDISPVINDQGVICWARAFGPVTPDARWLEIVMRMPDGTITRLTDNNVLDVFPSINGLNQVAWWRTNARGCESAGSDVMFFDGQTVRQITNNDRSNQAIDLNDRGDIIWTAFNFCPGGFNWISKIKLYRDGEILTINDQGLQAQGSHLNNNGLCTWSVYDPELGEQSINLWQDGVTTRLTNWGYRPVLNDLGDVAMHRWDFDTSSWEVWAFHRGFFVQLTNDPTVDDVEVDLNNRGEISWISGVVFEFDVKLMHRLDAGDLNCDGTVDALDIEGFLLALFEPGLYDPNDPPACDITLADINEDGAVDAFDIEPFIELLFP